uniref:BTB domain-containing protein n=1 Tax=Oryza rufipogon TaxID=4529 RepID=A0A0E0QZD8_ORYRU
MSSPSSQQPASAIKAPTTSGYHRLRIDYYRSLGSPTGWALSSRDFVVGGRQWRISYYPNGNRPENAEFISVFLCLDSSSPKPAMLQVTITFDDEAKKQSQLRKAPVITIAPGACWGYHRFVKRDDLARSKRIRPDGFFTIRCDVSLIDHFTAQEDEPVFVSVPPSELRRDLGGLLDTGSGGDVVFQVGGEAFTAHRGLLAARSPVLAAALYGPMMEGGGLQGGVAIKIDDMDPLVFKALLRYAYTDSLPPQMQQGELEEEGRAMAQHLLAAADRYGMERLRLLCEAQLCKHIEVASVASILILADQHGCSGLKNACFEFLKSPGKFAAAMATQEYDYLKTNHCALADEVVKGNQAKWMLATVETFMRHRLNSKSILETATREIALHASTSNETPPVFLDLEESLRAKGDMTLREEATLKVLKVVATLGKAISTGAIAAVGYYVPGIVGAKFGEPSLPRLPRFAMAAVTSWFAGKVMYYAILQGSTEFILKHGEERMKMELANIILNKHSDDKTLVEAVKTQFFAEHLFSDQYQDRTLFRWHLRRTYVDSAFMERVKEIEVKSSNDGPGLISGQRIISTRPFGDLMEDPLACILGSPDSNMESNKSAEHTGTIVKRREIACPPAVLVEPIRLQPNVPICSLLARSRTGSNLEVSPVILDLEESLLAKGNMTLEEEVTIRVSKMTASVFKVFATAAFGASSYYALGLGPKIGEPPIPRFPRIGVSTGIAWFGGKFVYYTALRAGAEFILKRGEERMKMELANIILNKHSDEKTLVEAVKENFFAEHLFSDQYQDRQLFRWHLRNTYVDSAFMERVKEIEVKNSDDGSGSISGHRTTNTRSFGDLMEDPLACILGSSDSNIQSNKSAEHTGTTDYPSDFQSQATDRSRFSGMNISVHEQNEFHRDDDCYLDRNWGSKPSHAFADY